MEPTGFAKKHRAQMIMEKLGQCDGIIKTCISICPDSRLTRILEELQENVVDAAAKAEMLSNGDEQIQSSKKPIKSGTDPNVNEDGTFTKEYIMDNPELFTQDVFDKYGISREDLLRKQYNIDSSIQGQERGIQAIMDEYGCTREEAIEIMNGEVTSGCYDKAKKKSKKSVKSSDIRDTRRQRNTKTLTSALEKMF